MGVCQRGWEGRKCNFYIAAGGYSLRRAFVADLALPEKKRFPPNVNGTFSWCCGGRTRRHARIPAWGRAAFITPCAFSPTLEGFPDRAARIDVLFPAKTSVWKTRSGADVPAGPGSAASFACLSRSLALGPHPQRSGGRTRSPKVPPGSGRNPRDVSAASLRPNYSRIFFYLIKTDFS